MIAILDLEGMKSSKATGTHQLFSYHTRMTADKAANWRVSKQFPRQRNISKPNVSRLAEEMRNGRFVPGTQIYLARLPDETEYILNGNHTLEAIVESEIPQQLLITISRVADEDEAGRLYAVFDTQKTRSWLDSLRAMKSPHEFSKDSPKILAAIGFIERRFGHASPPVISRVGRIDRMNDYSRAIETMRQATNEGTLEARRFFVRAAMMGVALYTFEHQPTAATEFWSTFISDEGLTTGMPAKALMTYMRNNHFTSGGAEAQKTQAKAVALAWNASFRGDSLQVCKVNALSSFFLLGTPIAKGLAHTKEEEQ